MITHLRYDKGQQDDGFTLIELLVVIIIIGVLAAIVIPAFLNQRKKGIDASLRSDLKAAALVQETWIADNPDRVGTQTKADFTAAGFKKTGNNTIYASLFTRTGDEDRWGYCLFGFNPGASDSYNDNIYNLMAYDSANGGFLNYSAARTTGGTGIMPSGGACGSGRTAVTIIS